MNDIIMYRGGVITVQCTPSWRKRCRISLCSVTRANRVIAVDYAIDIDAK